MSLEPPGEQRAGHPEVAAALERLAALDTLSVAEHIAVYEEVHHRLGAAMDDAELADVASGDVEPDGAASGAVGDPRPSTGPG